MTTEPGMAGPYSLEIVRKTCERNLQGHVQKVDHRLSAGQAVNNRQLTIFPHVISSVKLDADVLEKRMFTKVLSQLLPEVLVKRYDRFNADQEVPDAIAFIRRMQRIGIKPKSHQDRIQTQLLFE
jgi:hypothetical protein